MRDDVHPLIAGGAVHAGEGGQRFAFAENLLDHHIKRLRIVALRVADQAAQADKILCWVAEAVDVIEPQPL